MFCVRVDGLRANSVRIVTKKGRPRAQQGRSHRRHDSRSKRRKGWYGGCGRWIGHDAHGGWELWEREVWSRRARLSVLPDGPIACAQWLHDTNLWGFVLLAMWLTSTTWRCAGGTGSVKVDGGTDIATGLVSDRRWKGRRPRCSSWNGNRWRKRRVEVDNSRGGRRRHQACGARAEAASVVSGCGGAAREERAMPCHDVPPRRGRRSWKVIAALLWLAHRGMTGRDLPGRTPTCTSYFDCAVRIGQADNPGPSYARLDCASASGESEVGSAGWSIQDQYEAMDQDEEEEWDGGLTASFEASSTFLGAREGMVFSTGDMGTGYYRDLPKPISLSIALGIPMGQCPVVVRLTELVSGADKGDDQGGTPGGPGGGPPEGVGANATRAAKRKRRAKRGSVRRGPLDATRRQGGQDSGGGTARLPGARENMGWSGFKELGLWAIDTVNPNCWAAAKQYLQDTAADAAVVSETKLPKGDCLVQAEAGA